MDLRIVARAKEYMDALAKGIDPLSGEVIPEGEVVRQERLMKCFFYTSQILDEVLKGKNEKNYVKKEPFHPHLLDYSGFVFSKEPISISELVQRINDCRSVDMQKLKRVGVVNWLVKQGYVKRVEVNGSSRACLSEKSNTIGITEEIRSREDGGTYSVLLYSKEAQQFIVEHLETIVVSEAYGKRRGYTNKGKPWTKDDDLMLQSLLESGATISNIATELQRTQRAIEMRMEKLELNALVKEE